MREFPPFPPEREPEIPEDAFLPEEDVILASLKLARALRRCPPDHGEHRFPPAVGRLLECVYAHSGVSSRDLCELLDLRPSSLSEILTRSESEGWIVRTPDEEDRRMQHVSLSGQGREAVERIRAVRKADAEKKTSCFTPEEKAQFCVLCRRLSAHLESLSAGIPPRPPRPDRPDSPDFPDREPRRRPPFPPEGRVRC